MASSAMQDVVGQIVAGGESLWQSVDIQSVSMTLHKATEVATKTAGGCMRDWSAMLAIIFEVAAPNWSPADRRLSGPALDLKESKLRQAGGDS